MLKFVLSFLICSCLLVFGEEAPDTIPQTWFKLVDGRSVKGEYIDIDVEAGEKIILRYSPIADSGVEVDRVSKDGIVLWRHHVKPLGIDHSRYSHRVWYIVGDGILLPKGMIQIVSEGY